MLQPATSIPGPTLSLSARSELPVGQQVSTWGFPAGYNGVVPLLTVGYLAGVDRLATATGLSAPRWVVNAAFNAGNSGGPVLSSDDGQVIGVVSSKLAPIPPIIESALQALANQKSGFMYSKTMPDGSKVEVPVGVVIGEVLNYLRSQTQLVLGHAVTSEQVKAFLIQQKIEP